jgi:hypothetical protein
VAGLFGSQFGTIGTVVGGAAGFLVSRWIGNKLFGDNQWDQSYSYGNRSLLGRVKDKIFGRDDPYPPVYGGGYDPYQNGGRWSRIAPIAGRHDLMGARQDFFRAMEDYKRALQTGSQTEKESAKSAYDAAREAFFSAKSGSR